MSSTVTSKRVPGGVVHKLPADLREALVASSTALAAWQDITPLARNEFICWVADAKQVKSLAVSSLSFPSAMSLCASCPPKPST
jgi:Bacteriocin-protection, YdeI or OmpD-Associated